MRLAQRARNQALRFGTRFFTGWEVTGLEPGADGEPHVLRTEGGDVRARAVVIATGVAYRKLGVAPLEELVGRRQLRRRDDRGPRDGGLRRRRGRRRQLGRPGRASTCPGSPVGDDRGPAARPRGDDVAVPDRRDRATTSGSRCCTCTARRRRRRRGAARVARCLEDTATGERTRRGAAGLFLLLGAEPRCDWLPDEVARDERGFVLTGRDVPRTVGGRAAPEQPGHHRARASSPPATSAPAR